jgi:hypothetical protein
MPGNAVAGLLPYPEVQLILRAEASFDKLLSRERL